jgi:hypothetical protein
MAQDAKTPSSAEKVVDAVSDLIERRIAPVRQRVMDLELTVAGLRNEIEGLKHRG